MSEPSSRDWWLGRTLRLNVMTSEGLALREIQITVLSLDADGVARVGIVGGVQTVPLRALQAALWAGLATEV